MQDGNGTQRGPGMKIGLRRGRGGRNEEWRMVVSPPEAAVSIDTVNRCCIEQRQADRMSPIGLMVYPLFPL
ncbi:hypothetical protein [Dialister sp.]|uniref:hypothetical protein n=1 Tax=Dialister sp. TaxID=1955814 RepID=UPI003F0AAA0B